MTTYINTVNQESKEYFDTRYLESGFTRNMIVNPDGEIAQQGTGFYYRMGMILSMLVRKQLLYPKVVERVQNF
jgi:hypothetical protein